MELKNIYIDNSPAGYLPADELVHAAEVAYALKRPLLLSGEPGTGKTEFARWVADTLSKKYGFDKKPIIFNTKSTSIAQDLFYFYDAIAHFRDANIQRFNSSATVSLRKKQVSFESEPAQVEAVSVSQENNSDPLDARDYITFDALGLAFLRAKGIGIVETNSKAKATGSVVLIDEIDKAPRDFPNDLLNEIEKYTFTVKELGHKTIELSDEEKKSIMIIMTSNFEKNLPEAFLRRCVYFHISFPKEERLAEILAKRLQTEDPADLDNIKQRVDEFFKFRADNNIQKKPTTSECLDYVRVLHSEKNLGQALFDASNKITNEGRKYISLLLKKKEDRDLYIADFEQ